MLALASAIERSHIADKLARLYLLNPLPGRFVDGVLILLSRITRRRYPLYFHSARYLAGGGDVAGLRAWLDLHGWEDPSKLMAQWIARGGAPVRDSDLTRPDGDVAALLAGSVAITALDPALAAELNGPLREHLEDTLLLGVWYLRELWAVLFAFHCSRPDIAIEGDPIITPWRTHLDDALDEAARVLPSYTVAIPATIDERGGRLVTADVSVTLLESFPVGVIRLDEAGRIVYENPALRDTIGAPPDLPSPAMGLRLDELPNVKATAMASVVTDLVAHGTPFPRVRIPFTSLFGKVLTITAEGRPIVDANGARTGSVVVITDVSREVELERQLAQAQRMEVFGTMCGGIAHDLNNLLVGVRGYAGLLRARTTATDPRSPTVDRLHEACERLSVVVTGLLALARPTDEPPNAVVDAVAVLENVERLLVGLLPDHVRVVAHLPPTPTWVRIGRVHLEQVLINVCVNGRDAILAWGDGRPGHLRIEVESVITTRGPEVRLHIADDGVGMAADIQARAFDPFFTTKPPGQGTGLGLPVSLGIVRSYNGTIRCESAPGHGAMLTITLPAGDCPNAAGGEKGAASRGAIGTRVLVVDDNDVVLALCVEVLESSGFEVTAAATAAEARACVDGAQPPFVAAVIDVGLPDQDGVTLARSLPDLPVLFVSGKPPEAMADELDELGPRCRFLKKPFAIDELVAEVAALAARVV